MAEEQFKRHIAYKLRIGDILMGKPILDGENFRFLELGGKKIVRVNVIGNVVERYDSEGDRKYIFLRLDDGSGQIRIKAFSDDSEKVKDFSQGQTILVIGVLRYFNNEIYISPEIVREVPIDYLLARKLEIDKEKSETTQEFSGQQVPIKDRVLEIIKNAESEGGIESDKLFMELNQFPPDSIKQEIQKLLEEGTIFEPRPGKLRYLG